MVKLKTAKAKGSSFEYDCQESLKVRYPDVYRTSERGFQMQYDLRTDIGEMVFECKRLRAMTWNQAKKILQKLFTVKPTDFTPYLLFKSNQQPCLVMYMDDTGYYCVKEFTAVFGIPFIKHESTRTFQNLGKNFAGCEK